MESPQSVISPFKGSGGFEKQSNHHFVENAGCLSRGNGVQRKEALLNNSGDIGILDVFVHQARDIHNICIYHKQDVYARICLTSDPENAVSTKTINGGGQCPVFNDALQLNVRNVETSLKCEIWMLSRVKNYLEDQLLGFALVPLAEVLVSNGKLEKEFSLSSTDLFHSPAGFVKLSISYSGASPDVFAIPAPATSVGMDTTSVHEAQPHALVPTEFDKIEFPDPEIVNQNHQMVSEYYGIPCTSLDSNSCSDNDNKISFEVGSQFVESFSTCTINAAEVPKPDSPPSMVSTDEFPSTSLPVSTHSSDSPKSLNSEKKDADTGDSASNASGILPAVIKPVVSVNFEPDQKMLQQDFVDMYMKSMQQFTESLEKMKLPLDIDHGPTSSGNSSSDQTSQTLKNSGARVFYGSRAFF